MVMDMYQNMSGYVTKTAIKKRMNIQASTTCSFYCITANIKKPYL